MPSSAISLFICLIFASAGGTILVSGQHVPSLSSVETLIDPSLAVPAGNVIQQLLFGVGVQFYTFNGSAWINNNVSADLINFKGNTIGRHFYLTEADPKGGLATWELFHPFSSRVTVTQVTSYPVADAIDWRLLAATSNSGSTNFGATTFVQRLYTHDGLPPAADVPAKQGDIFESSYTTLYTFSKKE